MRIVAATIGLSIALSGCSLFAARSPDPHRAAGAVPSCNPGKGTVGLDGTMAVLLGIASVAGFAADEGDVGVGFGLASLAYGGAALHGSRSATRCREALAAYEDEQRAEEMFVVAPQSPAPAPTVDPYAEPVPEPEPVPVPEPDEQPDADPAWPDFWTVVP